MTARTRREFLRRGAGIGVALGPLSGALAAATCATDATERRPRDFAGRYDDAVRRARTAGTPDRAHARGSARLRRR